MKGLKEKLSDFFKKYYPILAIILVVVVFFYPVWFQNKVPLPADALVGAHVPWTELSWEEYPAGVPIKNQEITDSFSQFYPWRSLAGQFLRAGKAPLWNPYMFSGTPFLATWHSATLYPLNIVYLFFSDIDAWTSLVVLQVLLAGVFMYFFLLSLGLKNFASFFGSIVFAFSGYQIAWLEFATGGHAGLWLPLLLFFEQKLVKTKKNAWLLPIPLTFFFIFTAGDFQVPLYITLTYILFGAYLVFKEKISRKRRANFLLYILLGLVLGILLSAPQLLPTIELFKGSVRVDDPYIVEYFFGLMHWEKIVNFIWPDFFGNVVTRNYWGKFGYHEYLVFAGVTGSVFAIFSFLTKKIKYEVFFWFLLFAALVFLFPTPLAFIPYKLKFPGLGTSSASRLIFLVDFCMATLAAFGFSKWMKKKDTEVGKIAFYLLIMTSGVAIGLISSISYIESRIFDPLPQIVTNLKVALKNLVPSTLVLLAVGAIFLVQAQILSRIKIKQLSRIFLVILPYLLLSLSVVELFRFAWKNTPFSPREFVFPKTKIIDYLQREDKPFRIAGGIPLNLFMPFEISSSEGYDPIYPREKSEWFSLVNSGTLRALSGRYGLIHSFSSPLLDFANVKYVVDYKKNIYGGISEKGELARGIESPRYKEVFTEGRIKIFENIHSLPRVWASTNFKIITDQEELIKELANDNLSKKKVIVIDSGPDLLIENKLRNYSINNFFQDYNQIKFDLFLSDNALVFLSESFHPGWRAFIDGEQTAILRANYIYQAVAVPEGGHSLRFIYDPQSYKIGKNLSAATIIILLVISFYGEFKDRRKRTSSRDN